MECECCGREMTRKEMIEELAERLDWEENKHYSISKNHYNGTESASLKKPGIESLVEAFRDESQGDTE